VALAAATTPSRHIRERFIRDPRFPQPSWAAVTGVKFGCAKRSTPSGAERRRRR
jgi:hypothetical protein